MKHILFTFLLFAFYTNLDAQKIVYTEQDREDASNMKFDIIGKINGNFLVYKASTSTHYINVFDATMKLKDKVQLSFINDRVFNTDFLLYDTFLLSFYQYQKRNIIYNMAAKIDGNGQIINQPIQLDTTDSREVQNNRIYSFVQSANKEYIMFFKINSYDEKKHKITTFLYNKKLELLKKGYHEVEMKERNCFLTGFDLNNNGNFIFIKAISTSSGDNISSINLITKAALNDTFDYVALKKYDNLFFDEIAVKVDNANDRFIITSLYSNKKRGDIQGIYMSIYDSKKDEEVLSTSTAFDEKFRENAKGDASFKQAFNNYYIKKIIPKKNGGFLLCAESQSISGRTTNDNMNRWDYFNNNNNFGNSGFYNWNNNLGGMPWGSSYSNNVTRYFADNIAVASFDSTGKVEWDNVLYKSQFDDNNDIYISFGTFNAGNQIRFLYNAYESQQHILTEQAISADGQINRASTLKNLDKGYVFMPTKAKQVSAKQIIVPCMYRSFLCFAKIEY